MYTSIKFTFEKQEFIYENEKKVQVLNFLDVKIIWHEDNSVETDIYYKVTNTHDYLPYNNAHSDHTKNNVPCNLAKRFIVFVFSPEEVIIQLDKLRQFSKECKYPEHVISKSIFNARLRGPAPDPERSKHVIVFVTTFYFNTDNKSLMQTAKNIFKNIRNEYLISLYKDTNLYCLWNNAGICLENWHLLDSYQFWEILENQELINTMINDAKHVKFI